MPHGITILMPYPKTKRATPFGIALKAMILVGLLDTHLLDKPLGTAHLVYYEQHVADVADDVAAEGLVELDVGHGREPCAVEVHADELTLVVEHGRA